MNYLWLILFVAPGISFGQTKLHIGASMNNSLVILQQLFPTITIEITFSSEGVDSNDHGNNVVPNLKLVDYTMYIRPEDTAFDGRLIGITLHGNSDTLESVCVALFDIFCMNDIDGLYERNKYSLPLKTWLMGLVDTVAPYDEDNEGSANDTLNVDAPTMSTLGNIGSLHDEIDSDGYWYERWHFHRIIRYARGRTNFVGPGYVGFFLNDVSGKLKEHPFHLHHTGILIQFVEALKRGHGEIMAKNLPKGWRHHKNRISIVK